jgi:hypothetical protein
VAEPALTKGGRGRERERETEREREKRKGRGGRKGRKERRKGGRKEQRRKKTWFTNYQCSRLIVSQAWPWGTSSKLTWLLTEFRSLYL